MQKWQKRLHDLMMEKGWSQHDLADATGSAQSNINRLLKTDGIPTKKMLSRLAIAFDVPETYFLGSIMGRDTRFSEVPLLEGDITDWLLSQDEDLASAWVPVMGPIGRRSYALKVTCSDMVGDSRLHLYPFGAIVIVDPDLSRRTGSRIIARLTNGKTIFRELREAGGDYFLSSLDSSFPPINVGGDFNAEYLGTVTCTITPELLR